MGPGKDGGPKATIDYREGVNMTNPRRKCRLVNSQYADIDLRQYEQVIIETIDRAVSGKNPKVFRTYFSTDPLTQGEAVLVGRELAKLPELYRFGKEVTTFRLFDGKTYGSEEETVPLSAGKKANEKKNKGGRMR